MLISCKHYLRSFCKSSSPVAGGFTLIELIVVSAIILIITAFVLFQQTKFNSSTLLRSLTYSVALSVRQAQIYGTSVRESVSGSGVFGAGYGVYFPPGNTAQYYVFSDNNGNGAYDPDPDGAGPLVGEELPVYTLGTGYFVSNVCVTLLGGSTQQCYSGTGTLINTLTIFFRRPNPDACFATDVFPAACAKGATAQYSTAYVQLKSTGNGDTRSVKVSSTGQIAVCAPNLTDLTAC